MVPGVDHFHVSGVALLTDISVLLTGSILFLIQKVLFLYNLTTNQFPVHFDSLLYL